MSLHLRLSYITVLLFLVVATLLLQPAHAPVAALLIMIAVKVLPLLPFAPAVWRERGCGLVALTLVLLVYAGFAVMALFSPGLPRWLGLIELALLTWLTTLCSLVVKRQPRGIGSRPE